MHFRMRKQAAFNTRHRHNTLFYRFLEAHIICAIRSQQGVLGIKVKIMLDWDPKGKQGPKTPLPDLVTIHPPKEEEYVQPLVLTTADIDVAVPVA